MRMVSSRAFIMPEMSQSFSLRTRPMPSPSEISKSVTPKVKDEVETVISMEAAMVAVPQMSSTNQSLDSVRSSPRSSEVMDSMVSRRGPPSCSLPASSYPWGMTFS